MPTDTLPGEEAGGIGPGWAEAMRRLVADSPFNKLLGFELESVGAGTAVVGLAVRPEHFNIIGIVHGGVIAAGLDGALLQAVRSRCGPEDRQTTVEMKINYMEPGRAGHLRFTGKVLREGRRLCVVQAEGRDAEGALVAVATGTIAVHRGRAATG